MARFAILELDKEGAHRVKAVIEAGHQPPPVNPSQLVVPLKTLRPTARILGCKYVNGEFVPIMSSERQARQKRMAEAKIDKIVWCYHDYNFGNSLAHIGRETVRWMRKNGIPMMIRPWNGKPFPGFDVPMASDEDLKTSAVILMDRYPVTEDVFKMLKDAPFVGGYYMLEGSRVRTYDMNRLESYDALFTPSTFCLKSLVESGLQTPVFVWGHGFDQEMFKYVDPKPDRPFTFLWFGDENRRKGYDLFLEAFSKVRVPNVRAWVHGPGSGWIAGTRNQYKEDPRIVWDTSVVPPEKLKDMMAEVDILVAPYRGEGFCLPALEAMASGRPCIMTRWSGPLDFGGGDDMSYWIKVAGWEPAQNDEGVQAIPSMEHLVATMSRCAENRGEVRLRGKKASEYTHANWRWDQKVMEVLPILRKMMPGFTL